MEQYEELCEMCEEERGRPVHFGLFRAVICRQCEQIERYHAEWESLRDGRPD